MIKLETAVLPVLWSSQAFQCSTSERSSEPYRLFLKAQIPGSLNRNISKRKERYGGNSSDLRITLLTALGQILPV